MLPFTRPWRITLRASILARTRPLGPTVRLCPRSEIEPSTSPSTTRSSLPDSSPFTTTDLPMVAISLLRPSLRRGSAGRDGALATGMDAEPVVLGSFVGVGSSSSLRVDFHMMFELRQAVVAPASGHPWRAFLARFRPLARAYPTGSAAANGFCDRKHKNTVTFR